MASACRVCGRPMKLLDEDNQKWYCFKDDQVWLGKEQKWLGGMPDPQKMQSGYLQINGLLLVVLGVILVLLSFTFGLNLQLAMNAANRLCGPGCYFMIGYFMVGGGFWFLLIIGFIFVGIGFWLASRGTKTHEKVEYTGG